MITRRSFLVSGSLAAISTAALPPFLVAQPGRRFEGLPAALEQLERANAGRLGVSILDTGSGERAGYRADERFAMCSTFKLLLVAAILRRTDTGQEHPDRTIAVPPQPLLGNSPLTAEHAGGQMTVVALCHAALTRSDNTAANLLLALIGGPEGFTRYARSLGDTVTRLDRTETSLNESRPGDPRDTTSPAAMANDLQTLLLGKALSPAARDQLTQWMIANETGKERLRAHLPPDWRAGDKTGSNGDTTSNDIAIFWPPHQPPILVTAYLTECPGPETKRGAVLAEISRLIVDTLRPR